MVTVREVLNLALPADTRVAGGSTGLGREIAWARVVRTQAPAFEDLEEGDLALLSLDLISLVDELLSPATVVRELVDIGVAALGVSGEVPPAAAAAADEAGLALLELPRGLSLREVEKAVIRLVLNRRAEMEQRGVQMYRQLAQCITAGKGLDAIVATLSEITGKTVALQDHTFSLRLAVCPPGASPGQENLAQLLDPAGWVGEWPQGQELVSTAPPIAKFGLPDLAIARYSAPIIVYDSIVGYISVLAPDVALGEIDRVAVGRAASVCAIEMAKEHAVVEAENRSRGEFVDSLLANDQVAEEALQQRATTLGYNLAAPAVVLVFGRDPAAGAAMASERGLASVLREEMAARTQRALVKPREGSVVMVLPLPDEVLACGRAAGEPRDGAAEVLAVERLQRRAEEARQQAMRRLRCQLSVGIGRVGCGVAGIRKSFREAEHALSIAQRLLGGNRSTAFDELRVYRLLFPLAGTGELRSFYEETLGSLVEYDAKHSGELVKTVEVFFANDGNLQRAADALFLHRNTLAYRLERIEDISGLSLHDPEDRLCLQLALKIKDLG
jgi:PucR family transcriptional regulator, purine catabolism regulatory protein